MNANGEMPMYPCQPIDQYGNPRAEMATGLTKREAFAMAAMQGMLANAAICDDRKGTPAQVAEWSVQQADALLAELAKGDSNGQG